MSYINLNCSSRLSAAVHIVTGRTPISSNANAEVITGCPRKLCALLAATP